MINLQFFVLFIYYHPWYNIRYIRIDRENPWSLSIFVWVNFDLQIALYTANRHHLFCYDNITFHLYNIFVY